MKNILIILFSSLIIFSCGENKVDTPKSEEVQRLISAKSDVDVQAAEIAMDSTGLYVQMGLDGKPDITTLRRDTNWYLYKPVIDTTPVENKPPIVNAGNDQTITLPVNSVKLSGFGNDPEGDAITYKWVKLSGGNVTITNTTSPVTTVTGLTAGSYQFRLGAIDENGGTGTDDVTVTVNSAPVPIGAIEGFGNATGGEGYETVTITSLSQIQSNIKSNRTLLVNASGTMGKITINNISNFTIDCYSTKQDVTVQGGSGDGINVNNSNNIIVRGFRSTKWSNDGINVTGNSQRVVIDHVSSHNNGDGNIDIATSSTGKNFTVQYSIMGNSRGSGNNLLTTTSASLHHNLYIGDGPGEGAERNPFAHSRYSPVGSPNVDFRNNLIHASGRYATGTGWNATANFVNNYYTSNKQGLINLCSDEGNCGSGYVSGNYNQANSVGGKRVNTEYAIPAQYKIAMTDAITAAKAVLASAGPYKRDSYEQGVINSIKIGTTTPPVEPPVEPPTEDYTGYTKVFSDYFNKDTDIDPDGTGQKGNGFIDYSNKFEGLGSFASRVANVSSGIRSEVQLNSAHSPKEGLIVYYANYQNFFSNNGHSFQFHPSNNGSGNGFYHVGGKLVYRNVTQGTDTYKDYPFNYTPSLNVWHKFEIYYKLGAAGYMKVYVDGVLYVNVSNTQIGDLSNYYIKIGVNMWIQQTSNINFDKLDVYRIN